MYHRQIVTLCSLFIIAPAAFSQPVTSLEDAFEVRYMPSRSMLPTLEVNDNILIDKLAYRSHSPKRGDIIMFKPTVTLPEQKKIRSIS